METLLEIVEASIVLLLSCVKCVDSFVNCASGFCQQSMACNRRYHETVGNPVISSCSNNQSGKTFVAK